MFLNGQYDSFGGPDQGYLGSLLASFQQSPVTTSQPGFAPPPSTIQLPQPPVSLGGGGESGMGGSGNEWGLTGGTFLSNLMNPSTGGDTSQSGGGGGFLGGLGGLFGGGGSSTGATTSQPSFDYPIYSSPYG